MLSSILDGTELNQLHENLPVISRFKVQLLMKFDIFILVFGHNNLIPLILAYLFDNMIVLLVIRDYEIQFGSVSTLIRLMKSFG